MESWEHAAMWLLKQGSLWVIEKKAMKKSQIWTLRYFRSHLLSSFPNLLSRSILIYLDLHRDDDKPWKPWDFGVPNFDTSPCCFIFSTNDRLRTMARMILGTNVTTISSNFQMFTLWVLSQTWDVPKFMAIGHFMMKHWILGVAYFQRTPMVANRFKSNLIHQN